MKNVFFGICLAFGFVACGDMTEEEAAELEASWAIQDIEQAAKGGKGGDKPCRKNCEPIPDTEPTTEHCDISLTECIAECDQVCPYAEACDACHSVCQATYDTCVDVAS